MSSRSLSVHVQAFPNKSNTERKINKFSKKQYDKNIGKQSQQIKCIKSYSIKNYPPKSKTQRYIKENKPKKGQ